MEHYYDHPIVRLFIRFLKSENFPIDEKCLRSAFGGTDTVIDWLFLYYITTQFYSDAERRKYDRIWNRYVLKHYEEFEKYIKENAYYTNTSGKRAWFKLKPKTSIISLC